jgi:hypothetical protein
MSVLSARSRPGKASTLLGFAVVGVGVAIVFLNK